MISLQSVCWPAMPGCSQGSADRLCDLCDGLHGTLAEADMLGRRCKRRSGILRTLFRLIDLSSAQLNLHIAKLCLAVSCLQICVYIQATVLSESIFSLSQLCVSGKNLLNICKLVFQISRSESNDILFQNNSIIGQDFLKFSKLLNHYKRPILSHVDGNNRCFFLSRLVAGCAEQ